MKWLFYLFPIIVGALNTVQTGSNATLRKSLDQPLLAAFVVTAGAFTTYLALIPILGLQWPSAAKVASVPWWGWIGGVLGATYVLATIFVAEKVGAAAFMGLTVTAGLVTSLLLDHYGWLGFDEHPAGIGRLAGAALMLGGLLLICLT